MPRALPIAVPAGALAALALTVSAAHPEAQRAESVQRGLGVVFENRSYRAGETARLELWAHVGSVRIQLFQAGPERRRTRSSDKMAGVPRGEPLVVRHPGRSIAVPLGRWVPGLYFARVVSSGGQVGYAPFVLRPRRLGTSRVAVVLPTNTWQAYNLLDVDGDGVGDSWYADPKIHVVDMRRPYVDHGVPRWYRSYNSGFVHWLAHSGYAAEMLSDDDLDAIRSGGRLARLYDLIVFAGHEEYVTPHMYDVVRRYRDLGGNLAFLSANNFFYRVVKRGHRIIGRQKWRERGRPEAALVGIQYVDWSENLYPNRPYVVVGAGAAPWLFRGTGLRNGRRFGRYGIEIDARAPSSPRGLLILARIPNIFGPGKSAEMAYYRKGRAKVFAAGSLNFGGSAELRIPAQMLDNLWEKLSRP